MDKVIYRATFLVLILTIVSGVLLSSSGVIADTTDNISVTVPSSCSFGSTTGGEYKVNIDNAHYVDNIGTTTLQVFCNDSAGFSIYAIGYSNDEYGNNEMIYQGAGSAASGFSNNNIVTGTATSGDVSNWSMKITPISGAYTPTIENDFDDYRSVPDTYTKVATFNTSTDNIVGSSIRSNYAVYVSPYQGSGTYVGKVKYTLVHPANEVPIHPVETQPGFISYNPNTVGVVDTMGNQSISDDDTTADLWATNFKRAGYGFAGWNDKFDYSGNNYGPNETINFAAGQYSGDNAGLSLYAIWIKSAGFLQDWNGCSELNIGNVTALTDRRDSQTYAVAKLADGKCWMVENLRLNDAYTVGDENKALAQGYADNFVGLAEPEMSNFQSNTTANSLYNTTGNDGKTAITGSNASSRFPRYNNQNIVDYIDQMASFDNNSNIYSIGNWYTWAAVVADTGNYVSNNSSVTNTSICPAGWYIPKGGDNNASNSDFYRLSSAAIGYGPNDVWATNRSRYSGIVDGKDVGIEASNVLRSYPNNFIYSGDFTLASAYDRGSYGYYWSSTTSSSYNAYNLYIHKTIVAPGTNNYNKNYGLSVRCMTD